MVYVHCHLTSHEEVKQTGPGSRMLCDLEQITYPHCALIVSPIDGASNSTRLIGLLGG